ncbi:hypothetical protein C5C18_07310 [Rathayibacter tritici]|uniref:hypothetical protein n=1 Tax=Rathayibacter tritici TaxID=33888 RepID=UPI000CE85F4C|nr:hypothetical protein [Rathayibacter tritici]PPF29993.1 hypothetical protein C5C06_05830 [Rathayibacter tritici]PPF68690.1 hypothetical protein C5C21_04750 [Rathayibacter tritici]PPG07344.1 hypothetical protein C5C18_07310 [Rathayibacter tritici]PPI11960.1 hypothetical protein C5D07_13275 [Rathayibacter tritici]
MSTIDEIVRSVTTAAQPRYSIAELSPTEQTVYTRAAERAGMTVEQALARDREQPTSAQAEIRRAEQASQTALSVIRGRQFPSLQVRQAC